MNEYTPTTEEVRHCYLTSREPKSDRTIRAGAEFDRWLNEIRAEAWDEGHGYPCDNWVRSEMCREYHPNPYRSNEK